MLEKVLSYLRTLELKDVRLGVAGSVARREEKEDSDIDIVVDKVISIDEQYKIYESIKAEFNRECDIIIFPFLEEHDKKLNEISRQYNLPENDEDSAYNTVKREVVWCDKEL